ncbi:MAG: 5-methyltetrahydrofolate--homocysteine methyltransferase [Kiritimatiellia bacterium]|jgi:5-methyltetrahydrofolate--homocysteine methyltransferase
MSERPDYAEMNQLLYTGKAKEINALTDKYIHEWKRPVKEVLEEGLIAGMAVVGEDFKNNILYVPEVLIAARAMKAGMKIIQPILSESDEVQPAGILLMGTVKGDLHDIGKNLVCMMAEGAGFEVVDIGVDANTEMYINAVREHKATILGMSALLTTTMGYMAKVIEAMEEAGLGHIPCTVGGAPVTQMFADEIGADGYADDAAAAVELFMELAKAQRA